MSKTKTATNKRRWRLFGGVAFNPEGETPRSEYGPPCHYVVLMQSMHSGTSVYGPFLTDDAAHRWIREQGENELFQRFDRAAVPGVSFHVEWLDIPTTRGDD